MTKYLTRNLLRRVNTTRSPLVLAMAFTVQKPQWGSQATLSSMSLVSFLNRIGWQLELADSEFASWYQNSESSMDPDLLALRTTQVRELIAMVKSPRPISLEPAEEDPRTRFLAYLANLGLLHSELSSISEADLRGDKLVTFGGLSYPLDPELKDAAEKWAHRLSEVSVPEYLNSVRASDRGFHPNVLMGKTFQYLTTLVDVANPFVPAPAGGNPPQASRTQSYELGFLAGSLKA